MCQIHPYDGESRVHCHSFYQKRASDNEMDGNISLSIKSMHIPLLDDHSTPDFNRRCFRSDNVNIVRHHATAVSSIDSKRTNQQIFRQVNESVISTAVVSPKKLVLGRNEKKRKIDVVEDTEVVKDFLETLGTEDAVNEEKNGGPTNEFRCEASSAPMLPLRVQDSTGIFQFVPTVARNLLKFVAIFACKNWEGEGQHLNLVCETYQSLLVPSFTQDTREHSSFEISPFSSAKPELCNFLSSGSMNFLRGDFASTLESNHFGAKDMDESVAVSTLEKKDMKSPLALHAFASDSLSCVPAPPFQIPTCQLDLLKIPNLIAQNSSIPLQFEIKPFESNTLGKPRTDWEESSNLIKQDHSRCNVGPFFSCFFL